MRDCLGKLVPVSRVETVRYEESVDETEPVREIDELSTICNIPELRQD